MHRSLFLLLLLILSSCATDLPPDVVAASAMQKQAWTTEAENNKRIVLAYDAELRAGLERERQLILKAELATGNYTTTTQIAELYSKLDANRLKTNADLDKKRDEFLSNSNCLVGKELASATDKYIASIDEAHKNLQDVIAKIRGKDAPTSRPGND